MVISRFDAICKNNQPLEEQKDENKNDNTHTEPKYLNEISLKLWLRKTDILTK